MTNEFYPFEIDVSEWAKRSKELVDVHCQFGVSPICPGVKTIQYASAQRTMKNNDGKYKCRFCSTFLQRVSNDNKFLYDNVTTNTDNEFYPFEIDVSKLSKWSKEIVDVHCQFGVSSICPGVRTIQYSSARRSIENNDGKYKCSKCSDVLSRKLTTETTETTNTTNTSDTSDTTDTTNTEFYPFEIDVSELTYGSCKMVKVQCQFVISPLCYGVQERQYRSAYSTMERNDGKYICMGCSRLLKGRDGPACKYKTLDVTLMKNIDSEEKAYFLGWTASDGHLRSDGVRNCVSIRIHKNDIKIIETLRDFVCKELPIRHSKQNITELVGFTASSIRLVKDMCRHLKIKPGNKSATVGFPELETDDLTWAFLRGEFDGDGTLTPLTETNNERRCSIASISMPMKLGIQKFLSKFGIYSHIGPTYIGMCGINSLNFLKGIYGNAKPHLVLERKFERYQRHLKWLPKKDWPKKDKATTKQAEKDNPKKEKL